jgi:hypothetical protein
MRVFGWKRNRLYRRKIIDDRRPQEWGRFLFKYFITFVKIYNMKILFLLIIFFLPLDAVTQVKYVYEGREHERYLLEKENERYLFKDEQGVIIHDFDTVSFSFDIDKKYFFGKKGRWGVVDSDRNVKIPFEYDYIKDVINDPPTNRFSYDDSGDTFFVQKDGKLGKIDFKNNIIIPIEYDGISDKVPNHPGAHYIDKNGKIGIIKNSAEVIIPPIYDSLYVKSFGDIIKAKLNGKFGVINSKHEILIPFKYDALMVDTKDKKIKKDDGFDYYALILNKYVVKLNGEWMYLNKKGKIIKRGMTQEEIEDIYIDHQSSRPKWMLNNYDFEYMGKCLIKPKKI